MPGVGSLKEGFVEYSIVDSSDVAPVAVYSDIDGNFGQQKRASKSAHSVLLIFKSFKQRNLKLRLLKISRECMTYPKSFENPIAQDGFSSFDFMRYMRVESRPIQVLLVSLSLASIYVGDSQTLKKFDSIS